VCWWRDAGQEDRSRLLKHRRQGRRCLFEGSRHVYTFGSGRIVVFAMTLEGSLSCKNVESLVVFKETRERNRRRPVRLGPVRFSESSRVERMRWFDFRIALQIPIARESDKTPAHYASAVFPEHRPTGQANGVQRDSRWFGPVIECMLRAV
jgi:hypothetical protein